MQVCHRIVDRRELRSLVPVILGPGPMVMLGFTLTPIWSNRPSFEARRRRRRLMMGGLAKAISGRVSKRAKGSRALSARRSNQIKSVRTFSNFQMALKIRTFTCKMRNHHKNRKSWNRKNHNQSKTPSQALKKSDSKTIWPMRIPNPPATNSIHPWSAPR